MTKHKHRNEQEPPNPERRKLLTTLPAGLGLLILAPALSSDITRILVPHEPAVNPAPDPVRQVLAQQSLPTEPEDLPPKNLIPRQSDAASRSAPRPPVPLRPRLMKTARQQLGKPYVYGATGPHAFDCSGLTQFVYAHNDLHLPRVADDQLRYCHRVRSPKEGDLVFFVSRRGYAHHVALWVSKGVMLAAPHSGERVKIQDIYSSSVIFGRHPKLVNT